jgi:hypothetical protein
VVPAEGAHHEAQLQQDNITNRNKIVPITMDFCCFWFGKEPLCQKPKNVEVEE